MPRTSLMIDGLIVNGPRSVDSHFGQTAPEGKDWIVRRINRLAIILLAAVSPCSVLVSP
jgi:hypothetical protein